MTFTSKSVSGLDVLDDVAHGLAQVLVVLHVPFHGLEGVDDGGVIAAGEFPADLFHAHAGDLPQDVDGHTAGRGHIGVALVTKCCQGNYEGDGNGIFYVFIQVTDDQYLSGETNF